MVAGWCDCSVDCVMGVPLPYADHGNILAFSQCYGRVPVHAVVERNVAYMSNKIIELFCAQLYSAQSMTSTKNLKITL